MASTLFSVVPSKGSWSNSLKPLKHHWLLHSFLQYLYSSCVMNARHWASLQLWMEGAVHHWVSLYHCIVWAHKIYTHRDYTYNLFKAIWFPLNSKHAAKIWCDGSRDASSHGLRRLARGRRLRSALTGARAQAVCSLSSQLVLTASGSGLRRQVPF